MARRARRRERQIERDRPVLRVLDRLGKCDAVAEAPSPYGEDAREKLLAKLDRAAERLKIPLPEHAGQGRPEAAGGASSTDSDLQSRTSDLDLL